MFYPKLKNFKCVPSHKESEKKVYTPCNSRLTKINVLTAVSYVKISSVTLYYNDKILNVNNLNIELPPKALKEDVYIPAIGFNFLPLQVREFKKVTRNNLNSHLFNFGLAIKYSIVATNIEKTLYKVNRYSLATILFQN